MALTERRITIRLHYIYSGPRAKADRARLGHWFIYLLWGCTTRFALGTSVTCVSYGRDSEGCSSAPLRIRQPYFTSEWLETEKHQHSGFSEKRDRMCPHRGQNNIEAKNSTMAVHLGAQAGNKSRKNKLLCDWNKQDTWGVETRWPNKNFYVWEHTQQFEQTNSRFSSQPADRLQCVMALHYTHAHTSYRPFWPPFSLIILLNRAAGVLRDGVIIPPLWHPMTPLPAAVPIHWE